MLNCKDKKACKKCKSMIIKELIGFLEEELILEEYLFEMILNYNPLKLEYFKKLNIDYLLTKREIQNEDGLSDEELYKYKPKKFNIIESIQFKESLNNYLNKE